MTNTEITTLALAIIDSANKQVANLSMGKFGELSEAEQRTYDHNMGRVAVANAYLDFVASEARAETTIEKARRAA